MSPITSAGIIAAGQGSRFKAAGIRTHKPMIPVAGFPLIGHTLRNLELAGIRNVFIIFNERETDCADWVRYNFPSLTLEILLKSTPSSYESFWRVGRSLGEGRHLLTTVDAFCLPPETRKMVDETPEEGIALGLTSFVEDEKPLWVDYDEGSKTIREVGAPKGKYATAGFYNVPSSIFEKRPREPMESLRSFLRWLVKNGVPARGVPLSKVVDIDVPHDLSEAEKLFKEMEI